MDFTFLTPSGNVAFFRSDAEQAEWTEEELSLLCAFPYDSKKVIERGMIVLFQDPATANYQAYEIRNIQTFAVEGYQQFTAEDIAISELTDCHIQEPKEYSNVTAGSVVSGLLSGTGWRIGENTATNLSFADISRGSVWDALSTVQKNWNVYIMPRVTVNANGINHRYLDIFPSDGVWRGVRLSVFKNVSDPCVTYDDSELKTALYGYGASYMEGEGSSAQRKETTFAGVTWSKTSNHPAKPSGQTYLEDPEKTKLYGRNGKPRFGYYQTTEITDPATLLNKTWEVLKTVSDPKIAINGTVVDLYRMGYKDEPLRLHDMAIVELEPLGVQFNKQIIQITVDLLDPSRTVVNVGDYIPNIIYINRDTQEEATGGGGSGGGSSNNKKERGEFETTIAWNERNIDLNARHIDEHGNILQQAGMYIDPITGVLIYAEDNQNMVGSKFHVLSNEISANVKKTNEHGEILKQAGLKIGADGVLIYATNNKNMIGSQFKVLSDNITANVKKTDKHGNILEQAGLKLNSKGVLIYAEDNKNMIGSKLKVESDRISLVVSGSGDKAKVNAASIVLGINNQTGSYVKIKADTINLSGYVTASSLEAVDAKIDNLTSGYAQATELNAVNMKCNNFYFGGTRIYSSYPVLTTGGNLVYVLGHT